MSSLTLIPCVVSPSCRIVCNSNLHLTLARSRKLAAIEWGYRRYGYIGNLKLQTWIRSQFRKMDEWAVPGCRDFSAWGMHAARTREKKPNLTTPEALLRTKMPKQPKPCNPPSAPVI
jgi:hypothetical protein